uniref:Ig-like domain-containing protein n=1 Tax=Astyanax mexicanus TaxID=7994 RepID=A0A3B1JRA8_ASTMX
LLFAALTHAGKLWLQIQSWTPIVNDNPDQSSISISEGRSITLSCTYTGSAYSLHWYQQKPGSRPEFLVLINEASGTNVTDQQLDPRLSIKLHKQEKKVDLEISSTAVSDSALYYCGAASLFYFLC